MNKIKLDDFWNIEADSNSWKLIRSEERLTKNPKTQEENMSVVEDIYYFPTIQSCLKRYSSEAIKPSEDLKEINNTLKTIADTLGKYKNIYVVNGKLKQT